MRSDHPGLPLARIPLGWLGQNLPPYLRCISSWRFSTPTCSVAVDAHMSMLSSELSPAAYEGSCLPLQSFLLRICFYPFNTARLWFSFDFTHSWKIPGHCGNSSALTFPFYFSYLILSPARSWREREMDLLERKVTSQTHRSIRSKMIDSGNWQTTHLSGLRTPEAENLKTGCHA